MQPTLVRLLAAIGGGLTLAFIGYNLILSPRETIKPSVNAWMLDVFKKEIELPVNITEHNIVNSSDWHGFGDYDIIIQIKCDENTAKIYRNRCFEKFLKTEKEEVPDKFRNINYSIQFNYAIDPSADYKILFSDADHSSILIRTIKR